MPINEMIEKWIFFLTESESYSRLVLLDSLQPHGFYSPWNYQARILELFHSPGDFSDSPHIGRLNLRILVFISFEVAFG